MQSEHPSEPQWHRDQPYPARLASIVRLTAANSAKDVRHVEIDLGDSGLVYEPGDTLGLWIRNDPGLVRQILDTCALDGDEPVTLDERTLPLREALTRRLELTQAHPGFLKHYAELNPAPALKSIAGNPQELRRYLDHRQIIEILLEFPVHLSAQALVRCLRHLNPRQYSIASSPLRDPRRVDLTVNVVRFQGPNGPRQGAGSSYIGARSAVGDELSVFIVPNPNFRLPPDPDATLIMIGPGTGIAPFRAFLQQRESSGAHGQNWLFSGNPYRATDFLYREELLRWQASGHLQRLELAFSRDQEEKRYVQHLLLAKSRELFAALDGGACVYVCGDARHMAEDVQRALLEIIEKEGGLAANEARQYLVGMRQNHRYQRDVY
jgi:sulfite reductase (NADPH) flavoprotein alpha-component